MNDSFELKITDFGHDFLEVDIEIKKLPSEVLSIALIISMNTGEIVQEHMFEDNNS